MNQRAKVYSAGEGKDDLAALYWFNKASDGNIESAEQEKRRILREHICANGRIGTKKVNVLLNPRHSLVKLLQIVIKKSGKLSL